MKKFSNRELKWIFKVLGGLSFVFLIVGILVAKWAAEDYKKTMMVHDYQIAGYLTQNGVEQWLVVRSFTENKTSKEIEIGQELLQMAGYSPIVENRFLPVIEGFYQKYASLILILLLMFTMTMGGVIIFLHGVIIRR